MPSEQASGPLAKNQANEKKEWIAPLRAGALYDYLYQLRPCKSLIIRDKRFLVFPFCFVAVYPIKVFARCRAPLVFADMKLAANAKSDQR